MNDPNELGRHEGYDCLAQHIKELEARAETAERELKAERQVFSAELDRHKIRFEQIEAALAVEAAGHALVKAERDDAKKCLAMVTADMMEVDARADKYEAAYKACDWERQVIHKDLGEAKAENYCDACAGTGTAISGLPCMCKGTGKMSVAAIGLREDLVKALAEIERLCRYLRIMRHAYKTDNAPSPFLIREIEVALARLAPEKEVP